MKVSHEAMHESCKYILECYKGLAEFSQNYLAKLEQLELKPLIQEQCVRNKEQWRKGISDKNARLENRIRKQHS